MNVLVKQTRKLSYSGEIVSVSQDAGGWLYSWKGSAYSSRDLMKVCDEIRDYEDHPEDWTVCACCGHPLAKDAAVYPYDGYTYPCHEGACERDFRDA